MIDLVIVGDRYNACLLSWLIDKIVRINQFQIGGLFV